MEYRYVCFESERYALELIRRSAGFTAGFADLDCDFDASNDVANRETEIWTRHGVVVVIQHSRGRATLREREILIAGVEAKSGIF